MKTAKTIVKAEQATAVDFGTFDKLNEYVLELGPEVKIPGKVFGGTLTGATGGEFSFLTITDFTLHFSCCFTKLLHSLFITLLNNFTM